jgi:hypothetical protein
MGLQQFGRIFLSLIVINKAKKEEGNPANFKIF